ncbi:SDR family oxidoreductase [Sphingomonas sp. BAUL-RG-20F-R05-02]|uniref:SDR family oxidoreductase n=1 Tax=Sphingomonas sp. BAUL-RG-20F-R05-02 TaxID=2914830 RepID=UPI001F58403A|nr:SDR family oxidoreductase [Sphingomonas sp. BAUL-RG-20F-R05-02]
MDLGIIGRRALVCASSAGLGYACASALAREGCTVIINGRDAERLERARDAITGASAGDVIAVRADVGTREGRKALLDAAGQVDILVTNNGGPAPGRFLDWEEDVWLRAIEENMLAAIMLVRGVVPGMRARRFGRIVNITSAMVKSPQLPMALSTTARAGLTAFAKALARDVARDNVTVNNLLPERIETGRLRTMIERLAAHRNIPFAAARDEMLRPIPAGRFGTPDEFGQACAFLCAAHAGYITGQNLQIDGGGYEGLI